MMKRFLENTKNLINSASTLNVVLGNETCDLDSSICSIIYAYYLQQKNPAEKYLPMLNIHEREFNLRPELTELLSYADISNVSLYTFRDQLDLCGLAKKNRLKLTLVDHHVMPPEDENTLRASIVEIIDHRPVVKNPDKNVKTCIEPVGSCATLIAEKLITDSDFEVTKDMAVLLYGVIIVDTVALSAQAGRSTAKDVAMVTELKKLLPGLDDGTFYQKLHRVKISASNLTTVDLLCKDLKKVVAPNSTFSIAITVIMQRMEEILSRTDILMDIIRFTKDVASSASIIIFMHVAESGDITRQLAIYSHKESLRNTIAKLLTDCTDPALNLVAIPTGIDTDLILAFNQLNVKASRKALLPIINSNILKLEQAWRQ